MPGPDRSTQMAVATLRDGLLLLLSSIWQGRVGVERTAPSPPTGHRCRAGGKLRRPVQGVFVCRGGRTAQSLLQGVKAGVRGYAESLRVASNQRGCGAVGLWGCGAVGLWGRHMATATCLVAASAELPWSNWTT